MKNIVLIGMPAAGKSTIGIILAKVLGFRFLDTDLEIPEKYSAEAHEHSAETHGYASLQDIINQSGIQDFLHIEEKVILGLHLTGYVIATGGSVVYSSAAMEHLRKDNRVIYLKIDYEEMNKRIKNITSRGIVIRNDQSLPDLFREREPLYRKYADLTIECKHKSMEDIVNEIIGNIPEW